MNATIYIVKELSVENFEIFDSQSTIRGAFNSKKDADALRKKIIKEEFDRKSLREDYDLTKEDIEELVVVESHEIK